VRDYRIIHTIDDGDLIVWVVHVGHRSTVHDT
jgi:mRNA interferase RelE/StbE